MMKQLSRREYLEDRLDTSNMLGIISNFPAQCRDAYFLAKNTDVSRIDCEIDNIVVAGLGGSAIGADIVRVYLQKRLRVPMLVCRNYTLPDFVGKKTLLFCSSYSGNTQETISSFEDALRRRANIITLGSGGRLKELSTKNGFRHMSIPSGFPPRSAIGYMSISIVGLLVKLGFIEEEERPKGLYPVLKDLRDREIGMDVPLDKNISKQLAIKLYDKYCIVYGTSDSTEAVAMRWRSQMEENAKVLSSSHVFPELTHNEIVGWRFPKKLLENFKVIILRDKNDHPRTYLSTGISKSIITKSGAEVFELERKAPADSLLARLFSLIYIGDFISFYIAMLNRVDPTPVEEIGYLKMELAEGSTNRKVQTAER